MATYRHDPEGAWLAAVRGGAILLVPAAAAGSLAALWPALAEGDPTPQVLDRLTAQGVAATPSFALVVRDRDAGNARIVVRGPITVHAGPVDVHGADVSTWVERVVDGAAEVRVEVDGADVTAGAALPVVEAVVPTFAVASAGVEGVATEAEQAPDAPAAAVAAPTATVTPATIPGRAAAAAPALRPPAPPPPPAPVVAAPTAAAKRASVEQTMVPAEETIASVASPARPSPPSAPVAPMLSVSPVAPSTATVTSTGELDGDHDGMTVASIDIRRLREERAARTAAATPANGTPGASAGTPISIRLPDGSLEPIGQEVVLGRAPSVSKVSGGRIPRLVTIGLGDPDISRSHVRLALEGDTVVVTDLHSRNGTHVAQPGKTPVKLRAGEPTPVLAGTVVDFGGGWTIQVVAD